MAEEITTTDNTTTQTTEQVNVVNTDSTNPQTQTTQVENEETTGGDDENSNQQQTEDTTNQKQTNQPTVEDLQAKLKEYEVREEEDKKLRERLGLEDVDQQTYNYMNLDQQIVNRGKQEYLKLCNEYGIDADPNNIDKSVAELKQKDPFKGFEFERKFEQLGNEVTARR